MAQWPGVIMFWKCFEAPFGREKRYIKTGNYYYNYYNNTIYLTSLELSYIIANIVHSLYLFISDLFFLTAELSSSIS